MQVRFCKSFENSDQNLLAPDQYKLDLPGFYNMLEP